MVAMTVYKFRVSYEEDDSIYRDIEIKPSQTINDFEAVIISSFNLPVDHSGKFFKSNDNWQHLKQLNTAPASVDGKKGKTKVKAHALPILVAYIDDPHQKFIYEYKGSQEFSFLIELMSLTGLEKNNVIYPIVVRQQGPSPFKKEDLVAHFSKGAAREEEVLVVDHVEDDIESMNTEGDEAETEVEAEVENSIDDEVDAESIEVAEESEDAPEDVAAEEEGDEDFGNEEFGEDFGREGEEDFR